MAFDVFQLDPKEARELLIDRYNKLDFRWRWNDANLTGIPVQDLNHFARTGEIEIRYIPVLYKLVFGRISPEEVRNNLGGLEDATNG